MPPRTSNRRALKLHKLDASEVNAHVAELVEAEIQHQLEHVSLEHTVLSDSPRRLHRETALSLAVDGPGAYYARLDHDDVVALAALRCGSAVVDSAPPPKRPTSIRW